MANVTGHHLIQASELRSPLVEFCQKPADGSPCPLGERCPCEEA